jgi:hypothetical protein
MSRYVNPRAPTELASKEIDTLKADSEIVHLRELRDQLSHEARQKSGTLRKAEADGTKLYQIYKDANKRLYCVKVKAPHLGKKVARQKFFNTINTINTIEINKQLKTCLLDLDDSDWEPLKVEH